MGLQERLEWERDIVHDLPLLKLVRPQLALDGLDDLLRWVQLRRVTLVHDAPELVLLHLPEDLVGAMRPRVVDEEHHVLEVLSILVQVCH